MDALISGKKICDAFLIYNFYNCFRPALLDFFYCDVRTFQALSANYLLLGWFPEDTLVCTEALASLWGGISISNVLSRAQRLQELSMLTKVTR